MIGLPVCLLAVYIAVFYNLAHSISFEFDVAVIFCLTAIDTNIHTTRHVTRLLPTKAPTLDAVLMVCIGFSNKSIVEMVMVGGRLK
jgi:hypothetical protein